MLVKKFEPKALLAKEREQSLLADLGNLVVQFFYLLVWGLWAHESAICSLDEWKIRLRNHTFYKQYELTRKDRKESAHLTLKLYEALLEAGLFEDRSPNKRLYSVVYDRFYKWVKLPQLLVRVSSKPSLQNYLFIKIEFSPQELAGLSSNGFLTQVSQVLATSGGKYAALAPTLDPKTGWLVFKLQSASYTSQIELQKVKSQAVKSLVIKLDKEHSWTMGNHFGAIVAGASGTGKSSFLFSILSSAASQDVRLFVIDGKNSQLSAIAREFLPSERVAATPEDAAILVSYVLKISRARYEYLAKERHANPEKIFNSASGDPHLPPILLIIDEMAAVSESLPKKKKEAFLKDLQTLAQTGREANINILVSMQQPNSQSLPTAIREQLSGLKVVLGSASQISPQTRQMVFGAGIELAPSTFVGAGSGYAWLEGSEAPEPFKAPLLPQSSKELYELLAQALKGQKDLKLA